MSRDTNDYLADARRDAKETVADYLDEIVEQLREDGDCSNDLLNDYGHGDSYHHENHVDRDYDLQEAAAILDELSDHEEADSGLWQGLEPRRAIACQAAYTYGNAVYALWRELIAEINEDASSGILADMLSEDEGIGADDEKIKARVREVAGLD